MSVYNQTKAIQKRSQYARYGRDNNVLLFEEWLPGRIEGMKRNGFDIRSKTINGTVMVGLQKGCEKPVIITETQFKDELYNQYKEEYLSRFGLNCSIPFEENAGIIA